MMVAGWHRLISNLIGKSLLQYLWGWLIVLLSLAGNAEFWVIAVNRTHAYPISHRILRKFRLFHDVAILGWPPALILWTERTSASLLRGGSLGAQPDALRWLLLITMAWSIPLFLQVLSWQLVRRRQFQYVDSRQVYAVRGIVPGPQAEILGRPGGLSQKWPWNQYCHLEVNTKSIELRPQRQRLEKPRRTLQVLHLSDLHFIGTPGLAYYEFLVQKALEQPVDIIVFTGDLIDDTALLPKAIAILEPLTRHAACFFILGNHDWRYDFQQIRQALSGSGWRCVAERPEILELDNRRVLLAGTERPWMGDHPPQVMESGFDLTILLSHSPDQLPVAKRLGYDLMLSGHTHGGQVVLPVIGPVYSPSRYGVTFAAGLFPEGRTVLHVSRGIGGKDPLRWNCVPELSRLCVTF
jgi:predicted MPP superfamily phosphohydrolase